MRCVYGCLFFREIGAIFSAILDVDMFVSVRVFVYVRDVLAAQRHYNFIIRTHNVRRGVYKTPPIQVWWEKGNFNL